MVASTTANQEVEASIRVLVKLLLSFSIIFFLVAVTSLDLGPFDGNSLTSYNIVRNLGVLLGTPLSNLKGITGVILCYVIPNTKALLCHQPKKSGTRHLPISVTTIALKFHISNITIGD